MEARRCREGAGRRGIYPVAHLNARACMKEPHARYSCASEWHSSSVPDDLGAEHIRCSVSTLPDSMFRSHLG